MKKVFMLSSMVLFVLVALFVYAQLPPPSVPEYAPVCCADRDGICKDLQVPINDPWVQPTHCGSHDGWVFLSNQDYCNEVGETEIQACSKGCCTIRGKQQPMVYQQYECVALCAQSGVCDCTGDSLATCSGEFSWSPDPCVDGYDYFKGPD